MHLRRLCTHRLPRGARPPAPAAHEREHLPRLDDAGDIAEEVALGRGLSAVPDGDGERHRIERQARTAFANRSRPNACEPSADTRLLRWYPSQRLRLATKLQVRTFCLRVLRPRRGHGRLGRHRMCGGRPWVFDSVNPTSDQGFVL